MRTSGLELVVQPAYYVYYIMINERQMENFTGLFPANFGESRSNFRALAGEAQFEITSYVNPCAKTLEGAELACDVAVKGSATADRVLFVVSGTHGVEGFCGSGCQAAALASGLFDKLPANLRVVLVHALNPYGFAWLRRTNENNVDLNRNFVDHRDPPHNSEYDELHAALVPSSWDEQSLAWAQARLDDYVASQGLPAFQSAVTKGQYRHADGLFYGGTGPAWSNVLWNDLLQRYGSNATEVTCLDIHTGLGPYGHAEIITVTSQDEFERAVALLGDGVCWTGDNSVSSQIGGSVAHATQRALGPRATFIAMEYGTYPIDRTLTALRAETWVSARGKPMSDRGSRIRQELKDAFYVDEPEWKELVLDQFFRTIGQLMDGRNARAS